MKRGEIWWAKLPLPAGRRPVVLISRDSSYAVRAAITVAEVSTTIRGIPTEVLLTKRDGLPKRCAINTDNLVTIPKSWLDSQITALPLEKLSALEAALKFALAIQ